MKSENNNLKVQNQVLAEKNRGKSTEARIFELSAFLFAAPRETAKLAKRILLFREFWVVVDDLFTKCLEYIHRTV